MKKFIFVLLSLFIVTFTNAQVNRTNVLQGLESGNNGNQQGSLAGTMKSASRLFGSKDDLTSVIMIIPAGDTIDIIGSDSTYYHIVYGENEGFVLKRHVVPMVAAAQTVNRTQQNNLSDPQQNYNQTSRFSYLENKYGTNMAARLMAGKIWKGMTTDMVTDSWGKPKKITRVINSSLLKEEWIYNNSWLFFENDLLEDWGPVK